MSTAKFGELRVSNSGLALLVGLRDKDLTPLGREGKSRCMQPLCATLIKQQKPSRGAALQAFSP